LRRRIAKYGIILSPIYILPLLLEGTGYEYLIGIFTLIAIFGIVMVGYDLLKGYAGVFSVAQFAFFGIGAYCSALLTGRCGFPHILALIIGIALSLGVALFLGYSTLRLQFLYMAIATLAFGEIFYRILVGFPGVTGGAVGVHVPPFSILGYTFITDIQYYYLTWSIAVVGSVAAKNAVASGWGRVLKAQNTDPIAAGCMGIPVAKVTIHVFLISAAYASVAGSLYAHFQNFVVPHQFSLVLAMDLIFMLFMGGIQTIWGGFIGVTIFQILPEILEFLLDYRPFFSGIILVVILIFMPRGIAGILTRLWTDVLGKFKVVRKLILNASQTGAK